MINRNIYETIKAHLTKKEISLIVGPRQAGKTTLMRLLEAHLKQQGRKTLFLNLDSDSDHPHFSSQQALMRKINLEFGTQPGFVFIDEIQRKENAGIFLKGIYDQNIPHKLIVSGSGSLELKEKVHESLAGRKRIFEVNTLSFKEFVDHKTGYKYQGHLSEFFKTETGGSGSRHLLNEYLCFGGYPRVVLEEEEREKKMIIDEILGSYLERDIAYLLKVEKTQAFSHLFKVLAAQTGQMINYSELSSTLSLSLPTVKNYLMYAHKTFMLHVVTPYFKNPRTEITKSPTVYFHDVGLCNFALGLWGQAALGAHAGFLFQNFVFLLLKEMVREKGGEIHFWRTKDKAEVDFILETGEALTPVEVKYTDLKKPQVGHGIRNFIHKYHPKEVWVVNLSLERVFKIDNVSVKLLPYHFFI